MPVAPAGFGPEERDRCRGACGHRRPARGSAWSYSNVGYMMLRPHRRAKQRPRLGDVLRESPFELAGAPAATLLTPANLPADLARAHVDGVAQDPPAGAACRVRAAHRQRGHDAWRCWQALLDGTLLDAALTRGRAERLYTMFGEAGMWYGQGPMLAEFSDTRGACSAGWRTTAARQGLNAVTAWDLDGAATWPW